MKKNESKYALSMNDFLDSVPVANKKVETEQQTEESVVLAVPLRRRWYMNPPISYLFPFSTHRRVGLDKLGTEVWRYCNGSMTAERIIDEFSARHHLSFHEARISIMTFLKDLTQRGLIVMVGRGPAQ
jgi:hypothetical protein